LNFCQHKLERSQLVTLDLNLERPPYFIQLYHLRETSEIDKVSSTSTQIHTQLSPRLEANSKIYNMDFLPLPFAQTVALFESRKMGGTNPSRSTVAKPSPSTKVGSSTDRKVLYSRKTSKWEVAPDVLDYTSPSNWSFWVERN
jgi:hypothetical protein